MQLFQLRLSQAIVKCTIHAYSILSNQIETQKNIHVVCVFAKVEQN